MSIFWVSSYPYCLADLEYIFLLEMENIQIWKAGVKFRSYFSCVFICLVHVVYILKIAFFALSLTLYISILLKKMRLSLDSVNLPEF